MAGMAMVLIMAIRWMPATAQAAGSWVATAPEVRVAMAGRETISLPLAPPGTLPGGEIDTLIWEFRLPPGDRVDARLCHPGGCQSLESSRGTGRDLAGLPAGGPLHFRFSLVAGQRQAVVVQGLKVIVNYR